MGFKTEIAERFGTIQDQICQSLEALDGTGQFKEDLWTRKGGGGGRTRIFQGEHIVKGGVNFSEVHGTLPDNISKSILVNAKEFYATGVSIVLHSANPLVPIIHMNIRYFNTDKDVWWFGGGIDLTPHYVNIDEARNFHKALKTICDRHHNDFYPKFKDWADRYFFVKHRSETRGVGGIFFDRLGNDHELTKDQLFEFVCDVGNGFVPIYTQQFESNYRRPVTEQQKEWQLVRRGRYVEFNLVWDRGTKFGLDTNGRTESILMSLPPLAQWDYQYQVIEDSPEAHTLSMLKQGIDWINYKEA